MLHEPAPSQTSQEHSSIRMAGTRMLRPRHKWTRRRFQSPYCILSPDRSRLRRGCTFRQAGLMQDTHMPLQALLQHTPSTQKPEAHALALLHAWHCWSAVSAGVTGLSARTAAGTSVPAWARTQVPSWPLTLHDLHGPAQDADSQHTPSTQLPMCRSKRCWRSNPRHCPGRSRCIPRFHPAACRWHCRQRGPPLRGRCRRPWQCRSPQRASRRSSARTRSGPWRRVPRSRDSRGLAPDVAKDDFAPSCGIVGGTVGRAVVEIIAGGVHGPPRETGSHSQKVLLLPLLP